MSQADTRQRITSTASPTKAVGWLDKVQLARGLLLSPYGDKAKGALYPWAASHYVLR